MSLPTPYTVGHRRWVEGEENPHGYTEGHHGDAVDLAVHAIAPGPSQESIAAGRNPTEIAWTIYAPAGTTANSADLFVVDGLEYEVDGMPRDYTRGPWPNPVAGVTIELKRQGG